MTVVCLVDTHVLVYRINPRDRVKQRRAAEVHGVDELLSEDFQHGRHYGRIRVVDPFLDAEGFGRILAPLISASRHPHSGRARIMVNPAGS
jgi:predicted nucleic acid-binding protein